MIFLIKIVSLLLMLENSSFLFSFYPEGELKNIGAVSAFGIRKAINTQVVLPPDDAQSTAEFIAACWHLDPEQRSSASELVRHPWLKGADWCSDYRKPHT